MDGQEAAFFDDDAPRRPLLPPEDRIWRHPSELGGPRPRRNRRRFGASVIAISAGTLTIVVLVAALASRAPTKRTAVQSATVLATGYNPLRRNVGSAPAAATTTLQLLAGPTITELPSSTPPPPPPASSSSSSSSSTPPPPITTVTGAQISGPVVRIGSNKPTLALLYRDHFLVVVGRPVTADTVGIEFPAGTKQLVSLVMASPQAAVTVFRFSDSIESGLVLGSTESLRTGDLVSSANFTGKVVTMHQKSSPDDVVLEQAFTANLRDVVMSEPVYSNGLVIGLVVAAHDESADVMPIELVKAAADNIIDNSSGELAWLGVTVAKRDGDDAVRVSAIATGSSAAQFGIAKDDELVAINGASVHSATELVAAVWHCGIGHEISVDIKRDNATLTVKGTLDKARAAP